MRTTVCAAGKFRDLRRRGPVADISCFSRNLEFVWTPAGRSRRPETSGNAAVVPRTEQVNRRIRAQMYDYKSRALEIHPEKVLATTRVAVWYQYYSINIAILTSSEYVTDLLFNPAGNNPIRITIMKLWHYITCSQYLFVSLFFVGNFPQKPSSY